MNHDTAELYGFGNIGTMKTQAKKQTPQAAFFEKMRTTDALLDEIREALMDRSFEQKLNGGDNVTNWGDVGDMTEYERKLTELRDQIKQLGEYAQ